MEDKNHRPGLPAKQTPNRLWGIQFKILLISFPDRNLLPGIKPAKTASIAKIVYTSMIRCPHRGEQQSVLNMRPQGSGMPPFKPTDNRPATREFPELTGIDTKKGLANCGGKTALYLMLLSKFHQSEADFSTRFERLRAEGDLEATCRCVHTLKGVAAYLGANEVQQAAANLEAACKQQDSAAEVSQHLQEVVSALLPVMSSLAKIEQGLLKQETNFQTRK